MTGAFRDFLGKVEPIRLKEPLAETLGVFVRDDAVLEYTFIDVVKLAGHACPTTAAAYLCCLKALERLYPGEMPVRGDIAITVYGEPDEGVYGVMSQVFSLLTGAAPATGFKGLGPKFKRKNLLKFSPAKMEPAAMCFEFRRLDTGKAVLVKFYPREVPSPQEKAERMGELMDQVIWDVARDEEKKQFQDLWMGKVQSMLLDRQDIDRWLRVEEVARPAAQ
ncbi:MAG: hypothetical protein HY530_04990 [Chloroflexi bacterium]|nr:hypothetical protein [Chloroflexota bacterium]